MKRRDFVTLLGGAAIARPLAANAQQGRKVRVIGIFRTESRLPPDRRAVLVEALRDLGWIEGKNIAFEERFAENVPERLSEATAELVRMNVDVIIAAGTLSALAARKATSTIPIVTAPASDPVGIGLVAGLARPGGNVTGLSLMSPEIGGKRLELLKEVFPGVSRVGVVWNAANPSSALVVRETENAARTFGIEVESLEVRGPGEFDGAFQSAIARHADALITVEDPLTASQADRIVAFAAGHRMPAIYGQRDFVDAGGLMAYGADLVELMRLVAGYVDKILKGANPADLPIEQPTKFYLVINLKAAKAIGMTLPVSVLARADEVIE